MAVLVNPESEDVKEQAKWEMFPSKWTVGGLRPGNPHRGAQAPPDDKGSWRSADWQYPAMLFKAQRIPGNGKWATSMQTPPFFGFRDENEWTRASEQANYFKTQCQMVVKSDAERARAHEDGWRDTPQEAVEYANELDKLIGNEAAERAYRDRNMSEKAQAEVAQAEAAHFPHLASVPEAPIKRRPRRPRKAQDA